MTKNQEKKDTTPKKKETTWEFVRSLIFLIGIVVVVKLFVCDIFFIPSGSMEQTLHGHPENGDRIFCTKLNYLWSDPDRWEVFVFKFPYEQTPQGEASAYKGEHFIKRCVGLPGESIALIGGDVFAIPPSATNRSPESAQRLVKPDSIQQTIWLPVYNEDFTDLKFEELKYFWDISEESDNAITLQDNSLQTFAASPDVTLSFKPHTRFGELTGIPDRYVRRQVIEFACPVIGCNGRIRKTVSNPKMTARCPKCGEYLQESDVINYDFRTGYPANYQQTFEKVSVVADPQYRGEWWHFVPDLAFTGNCTFKQADSTLECSIISDDTEYRAVFSPTTTRVFKDSKLLGEFTTQITPGTKAKLQFYHLDGQLRGYIDNSELFDLKVDPDHLSPNIIAPQKTNITLTLHHGLTLSDIAIARDIYYYSYQDSRSFFNLPNDGYMALGDNCPSSNDSRFWGPVPQKNLVGTALFIWWPLHALKLLF